MGNVVLVHQYLKRCNAYRKCLIARRHHRLLDLAYVCMLTQLEVKAIAKILTRSE